MRSSIPNRSLIAARARVQAGGSVPVMLAQIHRCRNTIGELAEALSLPKDEVSARWRPIEALIAGQEPDPIKVGQAVVLAEALREELVVRSLSPTTPTDLTAVCHIRLLASMGVDPRRRYSF